MARICFVVDAFATGEYTGNPAAVVLDAQGLDDAVLQSIAAEFNLSETTFVLPPQPHLRSDADVRFRWFTPAAEVSMCGHATIAGLHALVESGVLRPPGPSESVRTRIETKSGVLTGFVEPIPERSGERMYWLDLPDPVLREADVNLAELSGPLRCREGVFDRAFGPVRTQDEDLILFVRDFGVLNGITPDFRGVGAWLSERGFRGLCVATVRTVTPSVAVQSRFFAPPVGIDEDPVTGSVHGPLAAYLASRGCVPLHDGLAGMMCVQGVPGGRTGLLHALVQAQPDGRWAVRIGGHAVTTLRRTLPA